MKCVLFIFLLFFSLISSGQIFYKEFNYERLYKTIEINELNLVVIIELENSLIYRYRPYIQPNLKLLPINEYYSIPMCSSLNYKNYISTSLYKNYYIGQMLPYTIFNVNNYKDFIFWLKD